MSRWLREVGFVHLHVHSSYSLLESALTVAALAKFAAADQQPATALTDTNNLFAALEFSEKMASVGIQPIAGVQIGLSLPEEGGGRGTSRPGAYSAIHRASGDARGRLRQPDAARHVGAI